MFDKKTKYHALQGNDNIDDVSSYHPQSPACPRYAVPVAFGFLILSLLANVGLIYDKMQQHSYRQSSIRSKYVGLEYGTPRPLVRSTEFSATENHTRRQELWDNINFDAGMIYITPEHATSMDLPPAQDFPWDPELKVYLLNGYHNLHCLHSIQRSFTELADGIPPTYPMPHVMHCLDVLRDDVLCHADDTPRYTTTTQKPESGMGQMRQCRDWSKLEEWAKKYSGCWRYLDAKHDESSEIWRWTFCPEGSPWFERVRKWTEKHEGERPEGTPGV
ncbi:MAG: hypothetical protein Q9192_007594 [Flavoplaca navasiana]